MLLASGDTEGETKMETLRYWTMLAWLAVPTVMYGGYALLGLLSKGNQLTPYQASMFRAGHAHAGVLLLMTVLYHLFLERTQLPIPVKHGLLATLFVGVLTQSGGFFLSMAFGKPGMASIGTTVTTVGAALLAVAVLALVYGLFSAPV